MSDGRPAFLSLFAGIGGFDLALERAGFRCAGQVEIDPFCQRVLERRWPGVARWADVRAVGISEPLEGGRREGIRPRADHQPGGRAFAGWADARVDLLVGGFPCQDLSVAGRRAGLGGERSGLFWEIVRLATLLRPTWGVFENVPGLLSSAGGRDMGLVLAGLRECWPAVGYRVLDSRHFGVPQRRRRVFFVCGPDEARVASVLFEPEGGGGDLAASGEAGARVAASLTGGSHRAGVNEPGRRSEDDVNLVIALSVTAREAKGPNSDATTTLVYGFNWQSGGDCRLNPKEEEEGTLHANQVPAVAYQQHGTNVGEMGTLRKGDGGVTSGVPFVTHALSAEGADASEDGTGRGTPLVVGALGGDKAKGGWRCGPDEIAAGHAVPQGMAVRRLTPTECARLQAFPDGWCCLCQPLEAWAADPETAAERCRCPDGPQYRAYGNAVTVTVVEWLAHRLLRALTPQARGGDG